MLRSHLCLLLCACLAASGCDSIEARSLVKEGNDLYRAGKIEGALAKFEAARGIDPDFPLVHLHIGYSCIGLAAGQPAAAAKRYRERAAKAFLRYAQLKPGDERGRRFHLQVLIDSGHHDEALRLLKQEHQKAPGNVEVVSSLGIVASRAGRFGEALGWYEKRASLLPRETKARYLVGTLCWEHLYKNASAVGAARVKIADRGIAALAEAVKLQPDYLEALTYINLLYRERAKGQTDPAARARDVARAERYHKRALGILKKRSAKAGAEKR